MKIYKNYEMPPCYDFIPLYEKILTAPSVLIAGRPGSGKSVLLNGLIYNAMANNTPETQFYFIDPKRVELNRYKTLPHCKGLAKDPQAACEILLTVSDIMENRYKSMERKNQVKSPEKPIYIFCDEIADIMLSDYKRPFSDMLQHILQLGRAANIHTVLCTQIVNRQVINGKIQACINDKIALKCSTSIESRQIINIPGAEALPKYGNAIWLNNNGYDKIGNIPLIDDSAIAARIDFWKRAKWKYNIIF